MPNPSPDNQGYAGQQTLADANGPFNAIAFMIRQALGAVYTATLVRIEAVYPNDGLVDVLPLVAQINGIGEPTPHVTIFGVPYLRLQGGANAVIMDPAVGDLGLAIFCDRDISSVKSTRAPANPGSRRQFSMADALYLGGFLNSLPTQVVQFDADGITLTSPTAVTIRAPTAALEGANGGDIAVSITGTLDVTGSVTGNGIVLDTHRHTSTTPGNPTSPPIRP